MIRVLQIGMDSSLGGIEVFVYNVFKHIDKKKIRFDFVKSSGKKICFEEEFEKYGSEIYSVTPRRKSFLANIKEIDNIVKNGHYDVIHWQANSLSNNVAAMIGIKYNIPVIVHTHSVWKTKSIISFILHKINYFLLPKNKITKLACSEDAGLCLFKRDYKVIKNGIEIEKFKFNTSKRKKLRKTLNIDEDTIVIGHVGRLSYPKNHMFLLEIYKEYLKLQKNSKLVLVGEGELKDEIKNTAQKLGILENVVFLGKRTDTDAVYSMFDFFVFPSLFEGLGIVLIEAQASGLPCFVSDKIPQEALLSNNTKVISLNDSANYWAERIYESVIIDRNIKSKNPKIDEYNIVNSVTELENIYCQLSKKGIDKK